MQEPLDRILREIYQEDINRVKLPLRSPALQPAPGKNRAHRQLFLQAAVWFVMLCILIFTALYTASNNRSNALANLIAEAGKKYEIAQRIPEGMHKLQQIFCITFNRCK